MKKMLKKSLAVLLALMMLSGSFTAYIGIRGSSDFSVVEKIGLKENLSPTRANGLVSMIAKIREIAYHGTEGLV